MPTRTPTTPTPTPGPSSDPKKHPVGDALYNWCRAQEKNAGEIFTQHELRSSGLIPNDNIHILLEAVRYLCNKRLFKIHDIKGQTAAGYELVEEEVAANYNGLTTDEQMVYASIESSSTAGIWTKTIKAKSGVHAKVLDRVYKSLEQKGLIKPMKSVKHPQRKMYIRAGLTPSEEATGGTWFNDGKLDVGMIEAVTDAIEAFCSFQSWRTVQEESEEDLVSSLKRKQPNDGFDEGGKGKMKKLENGRMVETQKARKLLYEPHPPGHQGYPTLHDINKELTEKQITQLAIPNNAILQVLDVMVYDDKLFRIVRDARVDESPDDPDANKISMYRCFTTPLDLGQQRSRKRKIRESQPAAIRAQELEDIGRGGFSEVPCLSCPVSDICGDGGPVNVKTCPYLGPWRVKMEEADADTDDPWPQARKKGRPLPDKS